MTVPAPRTSRYLLLDHWRGVACLVVLINHSVWTGADSVAWSAAEQWFVAVANRLWLGVPMFFVISGYCISATVDAHRRRPQRSLSTYLVRRIRRIFPPYWAVLVATVIVVAVIDVGIPGRLLSGEPEGLFMRPWWYSAWQWVGNLTLTEQWRMNVIGGQKAWFLEHAWTLSYEEQFYLVAAVLLWATPRRFFAGAALITICVAGIAALGARAGWPINGFFFDGAWLQFYLGVFVYYAINYGSRFGRAVAAAGLALTTAGVVLLSDAIGSEVKTVSQSFGVALAFASVLIPLHPFDAGIASMKAIEPLRYAGVMCYSLYLVHLPINKLVHTAFRLLDLPSSPWLTVPVCAIASIPLAWLFHVTVERRFMVSPPPTPRSLSVPVAVA